MTKEEAKIAMREGKKISHVYFGCKEWVTMRGIDTIITESGHTMSEEDFWVQKTSTFLENGWFIYNT